MSPNRLDQLARDGAIGALDRLLVSRLIELVGGSVDDDVALALALASRAVQHGHVCLDLALLPGVELAIEIGRQHAGGGMRAHRDPSSSRRNRSRPRAIRDRTVPMRTLSTSAISS